jgi:hypothetical protein
MIRCVARKIFLGIRINPDLKKLLEGIGEAEERSVSQICELLLRTGVDAYKKEGPKYLQRLPSRQKKEPSE